MRKVSYEKLLKTVEKIKQVLETYNTEVVKIEDSLYKIKRAVKEISEKEWDHLVDSAHEFLKDLEFTVVDAIDRFAVEQLDCDREVEKYYAPSSEDHEICVADTDRGLFGITTDLKDVWITQV
jgi:hypothetical protein